MELRYHGIQYDEDGSTGWFKLGILRLLHSLLLAFRMPMSSAEEKRPEWPLSWFDRTFDQAITKFQDSLSKFDRAAGHIGRCIEVVKRHRHLEGKHVGDIAGFQGALMDIKIYLDSMLFYLRIQADCLANVIPNLYGYRAKKASICRKSFRDQLTWFTKKRPDFDPEYTAILRSTLEWFEELAGKSGRGLRENVVHWRGTYQLGWTAPSNEPDEFAFFAGLVDDSGFVCDDIVPALRSMVAGYFTYLDRAFAHFAERLRAELGDEFIPSADMLSRYYRFSGGPLSSFWVYPELPGHSRERFGV